MPKIKNLNMSPFNERFHLNKNDLLIKVIPDYYTQRKSSGFNSLIAEDIQYNVGVIHATCDDNHYMIGHVAYFMKNSGTELNFPEFGKFQKVNMNHVHVVRYDEFDEEVKINQ
jgi:hypothetical protein